MQNYVHLSYSVIKMADDSEITTLTRYIPVDAFISMIERDVQKLIREYGHINCGLRHEELCQKLNRLIYDKKTPILNIMNIEGKEKWDSEWRSKRNEFFNKLFKKVGFINVCFPKKYTDDPKLYQLKSKHIEFCKKRDTWKAEVEANPEYDACKKYDTWIEKEKASFTHEYLNNVKEFTSRTVHKYFSTKEHPRGHNPLETYRNSKLDCKKYNPPSRSHSKKPTAKEPTNSIHPRTAPDITQPSKETKGKSIPDVDSGSSKTKPGENMPLKPKPSTADSTIHSSIKIGLYDPVNGEQTNVKAKGHVPPINGDGEKKEATHTQGKPTTNRVPTARDEPPPQAGNPPPPLKDAILTPATQSVSAPKATIALSSTHSTVQDTTSSKTPVTSANTHSAKTLSEPSDAVPSLPQPQDPVLTVSPAVTTANEPGTSASSSASTVTTPVTTTTKSPATDTRPTMSTAQAPILSTQQGLSASNSQEPPHPSASEPRATVPITVTQMSTPLNGRDNGRISVPAQPVTEDDSKQTSLSGDTTSKSKDIKHDPGSQLSSIITQPSRKKPDEGLVATEVKLQRTIDKTDPMRNISPKQIGISKNDNQLTHHTNADTGKILNVKPGKYLIDNPFTPKEKNDNPNIIPEEIPSLTHLIPTFLYTPFGLLLDRKRKRKKRDLRRTFKISEKPTYESPNITVHELEDPNLVGQTVENDVFIKLLKINKYKQEMQKRKTKNKKTLIEVHMEVLEEYKNDEWELHKGDFLEICLRGFINKENDNYSKFSNTELTVNNTNKDKTIEDIQKQEILWNNWIENYRHILEEWKKEEWFQILKNKWRYEEQMYKEKNNKLQVNMLNEQETYSIVSQKDLWKQWISKQANLIDLFNKEDWFKSIVYAQDKEKDNYHINEYNNITVTTETQLKYEKRNHEYSRSKDIIQKLMVQIHMMVLEECIKDEIIRNKELFIDNFIEDIHNKNNYKEKRNIPQCDIDNFKVPEFKEMHTSINK
ncbi:STP1 protein [Plasmodium ovale wallikeri]|uniref:STP1 protein n=1 Tax=Plasmodium ovale wallikeri TaxID=864142 RepID=A0A1A9AQ94_PLAOA|nr:STP1 protein [Plasmodium ovale wallikeri]